MDLTRFPSAMAAEIRRFPQALLDLIEAELAAGNAVESAGGGFPAPPIGSRVVLRNPISTRAPQNAAGLRFREWPNASEPRGFSDELERFFVLEPRAPEPEMPTMDEIRAGRAPRSVTAARPPSDADSRPERFRASMTIDYDKWHDGIGYAVELIVDADATERATIERMIFDGGVSDWRDVEALAALDTPRARAELERLHTTGTAELKLAVTRHAPYLLSGDQRAETLARALETAALYGGLSQALDEAAEFHPPIVIEALFRAALDRDGETACLAAGMLWHVHGKSDDAFDWDQRPLFLRFNTDDRSERVTAFGELCALLEIDPRRFLAST